LLNAFNGRDANGDWTLFLADWESGGLAKLDRWSLHFTTVPEPALTGCLTGLGLLALGLLRRWRT
jgi:subtilisin-like proprotein convertase family protein